MINQKTKQHIIFLYLFKCQHFNIVIHTILLIQTDNPLGLHQGENLFTNSLVSIKLPDKC